MIGLFVYGWFESLALVLLCLALLGAAWKGFRVILACTALFVSVAALRTLPLAMGIHTIMAIIILALVVAWLFAQPLGRCLVAASVSMLLLVLLEIPIRLVLISIIGENVAPILWLLTALPLVVLLIVAALLIRSRNFVLFRH
jgi:hypothetical protein